MEDLVQGDTSRWPKPPVDFKNKSSVLAWLGLPRIAQAKAELLFLKSTGGFGQRDGSPCMYLGAPL